MRVKMASMSGFVAGTRVHTPEVEEAHAFFVGGKGVLARDASQP